MKALLWKDWRQNRTMIIGAVALAAVPYLFAVLVGVSTHLFGNAQSRMAWQEGVLVAGIGGMWAAVLGAAFLGANAFAGERADRSAQFLAFLPLVRWRTAVSKFAIGWGAFAVLWTLNVLVAIAGANLHEGGITPEYVHIGTLSLFIAALLFAAAWMFSAWLNSPAYAAALSLATAMFLAFGLLFIANLTRFRPLLSTWCLLFGIPAIVSLGVGARHYLKRVDP